MGGLLDITVQLQIPARHIDLSPTSRMIFFIAGVNSDVSIFIVTSSSSKLTVEVRRHAGRSKKDILVGIPPDGLRVFRDFSAIVTRNCCYRLLCLVLFQVSGVSIVT
jgi:hypothetical protein